MRRKPTLACAALLSLAACGGEGDRQVASEICVREAPAAPGQGTAGMIFVPGGAMLMGAKPLRAEEGPPHRVEVAAFFIDATDVTNAQFAAFVAATGYVTRAERGDTPASLVFVAPDGDEPVRDIADWWRIVPGADWRHPEGPGSSIDGRDHLPVVQVAYEDALAYARWLGRELPSEAEWEYAARGGIDGAAYAWGDGDPTSGTSRANTWQGPFPYADTGTDGYRMRPSPVGCYPPNGYGLYDMAGNVWQWTTDVYVPGAFDDEELAPQSASFDPQAPSVPRRVIKGGSFLCADNYCFRYRPAARTGADPGDGASHIGFRTVVRPPQSAARTAENTNGEGHP
ncbi:MAG: formylglycine-generating enzyme family protein [Alphaproteobacteria bacterium]|nr:formylglycine-generating enzyme family protein [Alphaproteobacteria bacterium]